jgi:thioredoxin
VALSENIVEVSEATFEQDVIMRSHEVPVVVDFWAPWCGPCKTLGPMLERVAIEAGGRFTLAKINVDENPNLAVRYGVQGIPAVKAFREGDVVAQFTGAQPETRVRSFIDRLAPSGAEQAVQEAQSLLTARHYDEAEQAFRDVYEEDDSNAAAALGLVKSLLMQGYGEEAQRILNRFPAGGERATAVTEHPHVVLEHLVAPAGEPGVLGEPSQERLLGLRSGTASGSQPNASNSCLRPSVTERPSCASGWSVKYWKGVAAAHSSPWKSIGTNGAVRTRADPR